MIDINYLSLSNIYLTISLCCLNLDIIDEFFSLFYLCGKFIGEIIHIIAK